MENLEKLNYNPEEWYIKNSTEIDKKDDKDIILKNSKKRHSVLFYILCAITILASVCIYFVFWSLLLSVSIAIVIITVLFFIDRSNMKKKKKLKE